MRNTNRANKDNSTLNRDSKLIECMDIATIARLIHNYTCTINHAMVCCDCVDVDDPKNRYIMAAKSIRRLAIDNYITGTTLSKLFSLIFSNKDMHSIMTA